MGLSPGDFRLRHVPFGGCRAAILHRAIHSPNGLFHERLSPYKSAIINALTSKLAGRYYFTFAWLVA